MTYLSTLGVNLVDGLEGIQVVDTGINTDLVHDNNTGSLGTSEEIEGINQMEKEISPGHLWMPVVNMCFVVV